ncbi:hypothetical protein T492DRAFT_836134 [Pavlovales sp. CCMP2436]|nr:hypothetical protein T492DRAFT_836134 [Pavlovales sp. CCMP2436]
MSSEGPESPTARFQLRSSLDVDNWASTPPPREAMDEAALLSPEVRSFLRHHPGFGDSLQRLVDERDSLSTLSASAARPVQTVLGSLPAYIGTLSTALRASNDNLQESHLIVLRLGGELEDERMRADSAEQAAEALRAELEALDERLARQALEQRELRSRVGLADRTLSEQNVACESLSRSASKREADSRRRAAESDAERRLALAAAMEAGARLEAAAVAHKRELEGLRDELEAERLQGEREVAISAQGEARAAVELERAKAESALDAAAARHATEVRDAAAGAERRAREAEERATDAEARLQRQWTELTTAAWRADSEHEAVERRLVAELCATVAAVADARAAARAAREGAQLAAEGEVNCGGLFLARATALCHELQAAHAAELAAARERTEASLSQTTERAQWQQAQAAESADAARSAADARAADARAESEVKMK